MCSPVAFTQSGVLTLLKRRRFEADNSAAQLEMNIALGQTPPSVQPPPPFKSPFQKWICRQTHPSRYNSGKIRHDAAAFKDGPTLLTVAFTPSRYKEKRTEGKLLLS